MRYPGTRNVAPLPATDRRGALRFAGAGVCAGIAVTAGAPAHASVDSTAARFSVLRDGDKIGEGLVIYSREADLLRVRVEIEAKVDFGFVTIYRYTHVSQELWRDGRLVGLSGRTNDDGKHYEMTARPAMGGLAVEGTKGSFTAPADVLPLSYWHPETVNQRLLLDAAKGRLLTVSIVPGASQQVETATRRVLARRYGVRGDVTMALWYAEHGGWVRASFEKKGAPIDLVLDEPPIFTTALLAPAVPYGWAAGGTTPTALASNPPNV